MKFGLAMSFMQAYCSNLKIALNTSISLEWPKRAMTGYIAQRGLMDRVAGSGIPSPSFTRRVAQVMAALHPADFHQERNTLGPRISFLIARRIESDRPPRLLGEPRVYITILGEAALPFVNRVSLCPPGLGRIPDIARERGRTWRPSSAAVGYRTQRDSKGSPELVFAGSISRRSDSTAYWGNAARNGANLFQSRQFKKKTIPISCSHSEN
jgi:hypothetical protein